MTTVFEYPASYTVTFMMIFTVAASAVRAFTELMTAPPSVLTDTADEVPYT